MALGDFGTTDRLPDAVATPEGDGEFDPGQPLTTTAVDASVSGLQTAMGGAALAYDSDKTNKPSEMGELIEALDEISRGKIQP